jgi:hypothetical protein
MPRKKIRSTRRRKLHTWAKKQHGGFLFMSLGAIGAAIAAAISSAAPAVATGAITAASGYAATKLLQKVGGSRRKRIRRR